MSAVSVTAGAVVRSMRWALVAGSLVLAGCCVNPGNWSETEHDYVSISGHLTLKGSEPGVWWALTDDKGRIWKIASPTPEQQEILEKAQNTRVRIKGQWLEKDLNFEQVQPWRIMAVPESSSMSAPAPTATTVEAVKAVKAVKAVEAVESVEPVKAVEVVEAVKTVEPAKAVEAVETAPASKP